jgi:putative radical SAM enzyme (TIGR03279 family)
MIRVAKVRPGSIGADLRIEAGSRLLRLNGGELRDALDLQYLEASERIELEIESDEGRVTYEIEKDEFVSLGLVPVPDKIRRCTNACPFCFVKGNPKAEKLRASLYIKDDDYRLSFMFGHYVTLTNLRDEDWERIDEQRLSPLYVSVHATDPDVRLRMLVNPRSREINEHLDRLRELGVRIHAQAVLCPDVNDGPVLDRTISDLYDRGEAILSLSVVPVGLTKFNADVGIRGMSADESRRVLAQVEAVRERAAAERGHPWCYASDEMFLAAGAEAPGAEYFDNDELVANGVGAVSHFREAVREDLPKLPSLSGLRIALLTGRAMGPTMAELAGEIREASDADVEAVAIDNSLYGSHVTSAGLLSGADYAEGLRSGRQVDLAILSREAINEDEAFLDDVRLRDLGAGSPGLEVRASDRLTDLLVRWN